MRNNRKAVEDRQAELLRMVTSEEEVPVEELAEKLGVSAMTIRRDLSLLNRRGLLIRTHGKALSLSYAEKKQQENHIVAECRDRISRYAAGLVKDGETLFINGSRTALGLLRYLEEKRVRVITNNGWVLDEQYPENVRVRLLGGDLYDHVLIGEYVVESLIGLRADKLFIGCAAVYENGAFRYDIPTEIGINEMMISRTKGKIYVLADHTKLQDRDVTGTVYGSCRYNIPVTLVTDDGADPGILEKLRAEGIETVVVRPEDVE